MTRRSGGTSPQWTGVVLAGGRSRRFGGVDKTRLPLGGRTLLQRAIEALGPLTSACLVIGSRRPGTPGSLPDRYPDDGPLGGILTALDAIDTSHALVLAVDLPFISVALLQDVQRAGAESPVAIMSDANGRLALCLSVRRDCVGMLRAAWSDGARRIRDLQDVCPSAIVAADAATARGALWNVNDPLTYARALEMAEHDCPAC